MSEELKEKLKAALKGNGVDEEIAIKVLAEVESPEGEPKAEDEGPAVPETAPAPDGLGEDEPKPEEGEIPPLEAESEPVATPEEPVVEEPLPPVEPEPVPEAPAFDFEAEIKERDKTIDALKSRVDSLVEALKAAGVIEGEGVAPIGVDKPSAPGKDSYDDGLDSFFDKANRHTF